MRATRLTSVLLTSTCAAAVVILAIASVGATQEKSPKPKITAPPAGYAEFYTKHVDLDGFPILGSAKVSDFALLEARYLVGKMLEKRPDILAALAKNKVRLAVMASTEFTTEIPEHSDLTPKRYWDRRARGMGPTPARPAVSCGEENLLGFKGDPYVGENILIHEFAHAIHEMGLRTVDPKFDGRLKEIYDKAMKEKLWEGKYAATNKQEYWAEGVQSYFDTNRMPDQDHNHVRTREGLMKHDPRLAELIDEVFKQTPWRYQRPADRKTPGHLAGYNPAKSPAFEWPAELKKKKTGE